MPSRVRGGCSLRDWTARAAARAFGTSATITKLMGTDPVTPILDIKNRKKFRQIFQTRRAPRCGFNNRGALGRGRCIRARLWDCDKKRFEAVTAFSVNQPTPDPCQEG